MNGKLPNHVPIYIDVSDIEKFDELIISKGYKWVFFQIIKPKQLIGRVLSINRKGKNIEHHIRVFTNGKITSEFELPRLKQKWMHLTTVSYSSHEKIIEFLNEAGILFTYDEKLRSRYNTEAIDDYPRDYMEFIYWLFGGVIFWTPLGYIWRFLYNIRNRITGNNLYSPPNSAKDPSHN